MAKSFNINPLALHYVGITTLIVALLTGIARYLVIDLMDSSRCNAMLSQGSWRGYSTKTWQPDGCMIHGYQPTDAAKCLAHREILFIGDSVTRKLFFAMANIIDPILPTAPSDNTQKHSDHSLRSSTGVQLNFHWDPFLNTTSTHHVLSKNTEDEHRYNSTIPAMTVIGSGLWSLRYAGSSGGLPAWEANMETLLNTMTSGKSYPADTVVVLPVEEVLTPKLSVDRASTMHPADIDAMNSDLSHRVRPLHNRLSYSGSVPIAFPLVFNRMLDPSETEDGLHFSDTVVRSQANILLNLRCNNELPPHPPWDKTCCRHYTWPISAQLLVIVVIAAWAPFTILQSRSQTGTIKITPEIFARIVISLSTIILFLADRSGIWLKENKHFDPYTFTFLMMAALVAGVWSTKSADEDLGFLNRDQTDEWKGWMQVAILVYHYLGASKISGIYNPIRVLVASYLFMTGYGHTTYYLKKADFSFLRVAQVLIRLNLLTVLLAFAMDTDYLSYYFSPLVSMWFLIIYGTLALGSQFNDRLTFLGVKILSSAIVVTLFFRKEWLLRSLFGFLEKVFAIHWSSKEWKFRVELDIWIVYVGMFAAIAVMKAREHRVMEHPYSVVAKKLTIGASALVMVWYFTFELLQPSKFTYNPWHPYVAPLPILSFVVLRNATPKLRSTSSQMFMFVGRCSLELFIVQFHFWLAGDTKGILLMIPGTHLRPINFVVTTVAFVWVCYHLSQAIALITMWICGESSKSLPAPNAAQVLPSHGDGRSNSLGATEMVQVSDKQPPSTPQPSPARWLDRLAEFSPPNPRRQPCLPWHLLPTNLASNLKVKVLGILITLWLLNLMWIQP